MVDKNKPLGSMTHDEQEEALDEIGAELCPSMLEDARNGVDPHVKIVAVLLVRAPEDGGPSVIHYTCEYGDGEGILHATDMLRSIRKATLLESGEALSLVTYKIAIEALRANALEVRDMDLSEVVRREH